MCVEQHLERSDITSHKEEQIINLKEIKMWKIAYIMIWLTRTKVT